MMFIATLVSSIISISAINGSEMPPTQTFTYVEQPWSTKAVVVVGGLALIGTELWWFLGRKQQQQQATQNNGVANSNLKRNISYWYEKAA
jgi:plastocyanin domain-containing protein